MSQLEPETLTELAARFGTPLYVYEAATIRERVSRLSGFDLVRYAQKANSNLSVLRLLRTAGVHVDAVSAGEIERALRAGFEPREIVYTADLFDAEALELVARHGLHVNAGSLDMIEDVPRDARELTLRVNPGFGDGSGPGVVTGGAESKHGIWIDQVGEAARLARARGLRVSGLHVHIGSEVGGARTRRTAQALLDVARELRSAGETLDALSCGGGLPISDAFDLDEHAAIWRATRDELAAAQSSPVRLEVEPGRFLVAESGTLLARVLATKHQGARRYALLDAGFHTLVRPALYGAFHEIRPVEPRGGELEPVTVAGPLCETADVLSYDRERTRAPRSLPPLEKGDLVRIANAGAYGAAMSSTYNTRPLPAEVLVDGAEATLIRRRQTLDELLAPES